MKVLKMSSEAFDKGYKDGSLGLYYIDKLTDHTFRAWSESGKSYKCSNFNNRVLMVAE
ncbi:MAG: hypothetical protein PHO71_23890 [Bacteroides sp.]|nr:hypothetical protein [Bacteroides sp.]